VTGYAVLSELAEINPSMPAAVRSSGLDRLVPFLPMSAVSEQGHASYEQRRPIRELLKGFTYFERGDLLLAKITPCFENGKAAFLGDLPENMGFGSTEFHVLRPRPDVDPRYLFHAVWGNAFRSTGAASFTGSAGQKRLPASFFDRYKIPLPPLAEQRRIAALLDKADGIRRKRRESLRLLDEFLRSAFLEMFGDPVRNEKGWDRKRLQDIAVVTTGNTPSRSYAEYYGDAIEWIKSDNINTPGAYVTRAAEGLSAAGRQLARTVGPGAILMTCIAGTRDCIGNVAITDREVAFNQQINGVEPGPEIDHRFLYTQLLVGKALVQRASTDSMKGMVSKSRLEGVQVMAPPRQLQARFGQWFSRWHKLSSRQRRAEDTADSLFDSLAQRVFRSPGTR
jgi:type I restriction enzyme S subunit